jgi:hypothetical protein
MRWARSGHFASRQIVPGIHYIETWTMSRFCFFTNFLVNGIQQQKKLGRDSKAQTGIIFTYLYSNYKMRKGMRRESFMHGICRMLRRPALLQKTQWNRAVQFLTRFTTIWRSEIHISVKVTPTPASVSSPVYNTLYILRTEKVIC